MRKLLRSIVRFCKSDDGPTAVEYAVMLALVLLVCLVAIQAVGTNTKTSLTNSANSIAS